MEGHKSKLILMRIESLPVWNEIKDSVFSGCHVISPGLRKWEKHLFQVTTK
jgi:hypothetical protein